MVTLNCHGNADMHAWPLSGKSKNRGPSYPQGLTVVPPAPPRMQGLWVVATNNKEDVWVTHLPFGSF